MTTSMEETFPTVVLLEDDEGVRDDRKSLLESTGLRVVDVGDYDSAFECYSILPAVDLIVADLNLDPGDPRNRDGLKFAKLVRQTNKNLPMVAYSGRVKDGDITSGDLNIFNDVQLRGDLTVKKLKKSASEWADLATHYREKRVEAAHETLQELSQKQKAEDALKIVEGHKQGASIQETLDRLKIRSKMILPGEAVVSLLGGIKIFKPLLIWLQTVDGGVIAEVNGYQDLYSWGESEDASVENLTTLLHDIYSDVDKKGDRSQRVKEIDLFLSKLFGGIR